MTLHQQEAPLRRRAAVVRRASYSLKRHTGSRMNQEAHARQHSLFRRRKRSTQKLAAFARRAALVVVELGPTRGHCTIKNPCRFGVRPWYDVLATAFNAKPAATCEPSVSSLALAVYQKSVQDSELLRARAAPRCLWLVLALGKGTAPARGLSPSARSRGATCQLRPPRISWLSRGTRESATALAASREEAQHASFLCACTVPR